ncbi:MAG: VTT domain-containing protein [Pyrinomonas methylaliphatogenes]|nr:VTT domain-containing protein [Pyrinomonas methylaliphatogenes]
MILGWANRFAQVASYLTTFGLFGVFLLALLDSAAIPLPGGPDAALILLTTAYPRWFLLYVLAATSGSVLGCLILQAISRRAGRRALERFSSERRERVRQLIDRYDAFSVFVASILPPPFPFKLFIITAGVFRLNAFRLAVAIGVGRALRYLLEGYLAIHYGARAGELFARYYPTIGMGLAGLIILLLIFRHLFWRARPSLS